MEGLWQNSGYVETLPLHPQPKEGESFTSYVLRLGSWNQISTKRTLGRLLFGERGPAFLEHLNDLPQLSYTTLSIAAACAEERLVATTPSGLLVRFGLPVHPNRGRLFLAGCLSETVRYCPLCLKERLERDGGPYYSLVWRFLKVGGCAKHKCVLLETCTYCGSVIPFITAPPRLGCCPNCHRQLHESLARPLTQLEKEEAQRCGQVLDDMLRCPPGVPGETAWRIGQHLAYVREVQEKQSRASMAQRLQVEEDLVWSIECANVSLKVTFAHYWAYASAMGYGLAELIGEEEETLPGGCFFNWKTVKQSGEWKEWEKAFWQNSRNYHYQISHQVEGNTSAE